MSKFKKYVETRNKYEDLGEKLKRAREEFEKSMPFKSFGKYYFIDDRERILDTEWHCTRADISRYNTGNAFADFKQAEKELLKRNLIAGVEQFRRELYNDWQPDWANLEEHKYTFMNDGKFLWVHKTEVDLFSMFGYFRNHDDCKQALDLFGKDIEKWMNYEKR